MKCQECGVNVVACDGHYVCPNCGVVLERHMVTPLYHISSDEPVRGVWVYPEKQTGSYLDYKDAPLFKDSKKRVVSPVGQAVFRRLKIKAIQDRLRALSATHYRAFSALRHVSEKLSLPNIVRENATILYRRVTRQLKVSNHISLMAACLLYAVREQETHAPVTLKEIVESFNLLGYKVTPKKVMRTAFIIRRVVGTHQKLRKSEEYLPRAISTLLESRSVLLKLEKKGINVKEYESELMRVCSEILSETEFKERGGRRPYTFMAAVIYCADKLLASRKGHASILTQRTIAQSLGVAEYSLRDHYNAILKPKYIYRLQTKGK